MSQANIKPFLCRIGIHDFTLLICRKAVTYHIKNPVYEAHWRCDHCHKLKVTITNKNL